MDRQRFGRLVLETRSLLVTTDAEERTSRLSQARLATLSRISAKTLQGIEGGLADRGAEGSYYLLLAALEAEAKKQDNRDALEKCLELREHLESSTAEAVDSPSTTPQATSTDEELSGDLSQEPESPPASNDPPITMSDSPNIPVLPIENRESIILNEHLILVGGAALLSGISNPTRFFDGGRATYADIRAGLDVKRSFRQKGASVRYDEFLDQIKSRSIDAAMICGPAGTGKTTILHRIVFDLVRNGEVVAWVRHTDFDAVATFRKLKELRNPILVVDDAQYVAAQFFILLDIIAKAGESIIVIATARKNEWNTIPEKYQKYYFIDYFVEPLSNAGITELDQHLLEANLLGCLAELPQADRVRILASQHRKREGDILVALTEARTGRGFIEKINDEYEKVTDPDARKLYDFILICMWLEKAVPVIVGQYLLGISMRQSFFQWMQHHLEQVVEIDKTSLLLEPRHPRIAELLIPLLYRRGGQATHLARAFNEIGKNTKTPNEDVARFAVTIGEQVLQRLQDDIESPDDFVSGILSAGVGEYQPLVEGKVIPVMPRPRRRSKNPSKKSLPPLKAGVSSPAAMQHLLALDNGARPSARQYALAAQIWAVRKGKLADEEIERLLQEADKLYPQHEKLEATSDRLMNGDGNRKFAHTVSSEIPRTQNELRSNLDRAAAWITSLNTRREYNQAGERDIRELREFTELLHRTSLGVVKKLGAPLDYFIVLHDLRMTLSQWTEDDSDIRAAYRAIENAIRFAETNAIQWLTKPELLHRRVAMLYRRKKRLALDFILDLPKENKLELVDSLLLLAAAAHDAETITQTLVEAMPESKALRGKGGWISNRLKNLKQTLASRGDHTHLTWFTNIQASLRFEDILERKSR